MASCFDLRELETRLLEAFRQRIEIAERTCEAGALFANERHEGTRAGLRNSRIAAIQAGLNLDAVRHYVERA